MFKFKLIGEVYCHNCKEPIKIEENMTIYNSIGERCSHCDTLNIIKVYIKVDREN